MENLINILNIEVKIFYTEHINQYTKPFSTILNHLHFPSYTHSFICGKSNIDYNFALNCNIKYITSEQFFVTEQAIF